MVTGSDGHYVITTLPAYGTITFSPATWLEPGTYRWSATVDSGHAVDEANEKNNTASTLITVTPAPVIDGLDLALLSAPTSMTPNSDGKTIDFTIPITVTGPEGAKASLVRIDVYLYSSSTTYADFFYRHYEPSLTVGVHDITVKGDIPPGGSGTYDIIVDPTEYIQEDHEDNNLRTVTFPAGGPS